MSRTRATPAAPQARPKGGAGRRVFRLFLKRLETRSTLLATLLLAIVIGVAVALIRNGATWGGATGRETTDDAYVRADQIGLASHVAGYVETVPVADNATVEKGQVVATIRDDDYRAKVVSAEAALEAARAGVDVLAAQAIVQRQKVTSALADLRGAEATVRQSTLQRERQRALVGDGGTSQREVEAADADETRLTASRDQKASDALAARQTLEVLGRQVEEAQQAVRTREAALQLARIELGYTRVVAPVAGQLSTRSALVGEYVTPGSRLGLLVPLPNVWIVANFREAQMAYMGPGQPAEVRVDSAPGRTFRGRVESIGPASGALQALLPPDNATGNFTKVAQRFAVKIVMSPGQAGLARLRPGMSAVAAVAVDRRTSDRGAR